jgi:hypothetical protein
VIHLDLIAAGGIVEPGEYHVLLTAERTLGCQFLPVAIVEIDIDAAVLPAQRAREVLFHGGILGRLRRGVNRRGGKTSLGVPHRLLWV